MIRALLWTLAGLAPAAPIAPIAPIARGTSDVDAARASRDGGSTPEPDSAQEADAVLARWAARVEPAADELSWQTLPWLPSLWEGLVTAGRQEKPLLLWVMNGHPLGCT